MAPAQFHNCVRKLECLYNPRKTAKQVRVLTTDIDNLINPYTYKQYYSTVRVLLPLYPKIAHFYQNYTISRILPFLNSIIAKFSPLQTASKYTLVS